MRYPRQKVKRKGQARRARLPGVLLVSGSGVVTVAGVRVPGSDGAYCLQVVHKGDHRAMAPAKALRGVRPAALMVGMAACLVLAASGAAAAAATEAAAAAAVLADLRSISARRVQYVSAHLAALRSRSRALAAAAELGSLSGWASDLESRAGSLARPRHLLAGDSSASDDSADLEAARLDPEKYWQLPPPPPTGSGDMLTPVASVDPGRASAAAATQASGGGCAGVGGDGWRCRACMFIAHSAHIGRFPARPPPLPRACLPALRNRSLPLSRSHECATPPWT